MIATGGFLPETDVALAKSIVSTARRLKAVNVNYLVDKCAKERLAMAKAVLRAVGRPVADV